MEEWFEQPKLVVDGQTHNIIVHRQTAEVLEPHICAAAHLHGYIEIIYCLSGTHEVLLNWKPYRVSAGDMLLINSREIHQIRTISNEKSDYIVLRFEPELLFSLYPDTFEVKYMLPFVVNENPIQNVFPQKEIKDTFIPQVFWELLNDYVEMPYLYELSLHTNIHRIFVWILRYWHQNGIQIENTVDNVGLTKRFQSVLDYMYKHYAEEISVSDMAELHHMSYSYFSRMFKRVVGQNFSEYLNNIRIRKAEHLLVTTDLSITEIAMGTGFSSSSYFVQQFKSQKKVSPLQFRNKFKTDDTKTLP